MTALEVPTTIEGINAEIARLRSMNDQLLAAQNTQAKLLTAMRAEEKRIREEFERTLQEHLAKTSAASLSANALILDQGKNKQAILDLQAALAKLLEDEGNKRMLDQIEAEVDEYLKTLPSWHTNAAPYQRQGILEMYKAYVKGENGFANFDDMGLGKTFQGILFLHLARLKFVQQHGRAPRILWLTAKNLIKGTINEFNTWLPGTMMTPLSFGQGGMQVTAANRTFLFEMGMKMNSIMIANYEVLNTMQEVRSTQWDFVVIDEVQKLKGGANPSGPSAIWKNAKPVCRNSRFMLFLSGTPMVNHPREMWAYLHLFDPDRFDNLKRFESIFSVHDPIKGLVFSADKLLANALVGQCIRRRRDEVGIQLPEKIRTPYFLQMTDAQRAVSDMMANSFYVWLGSQDDAKPLGAAAIIARLTRLRQINVWPPCIQRDFEDAETGKIVSLALECEESSKIDETMELIEKFKLTEEQCVVYCNFNEPLFEVQRRVRKLGMTCEVMHGATKDPNLEVDFQQGKTRVLCIQSMMGKGMNLQKNKDYWPGGASHAIFLDLWWTPAVNEQCEDRIHRRGAEDTVQIHLMYNEDSIDQFMVKLIEDKASQFANILERQEIRPASEWKKLLGDLVKKD